jgi:hypothetical protein
MAEVERYLFPYTEIVTALLKKEGVHSGIWMLYLEFGLAAANAPVRAEESEAMMTEVEALQNLMPTAILPVKKIGIQRTDRLSNLSVDAAIVNPKPRQSGGKKARK